MKNIFRSFFLFGVIGFLLMELVIRMFHLSPDIPKRILHNGIQKYQKGQSGYYSEEVFWKINSNGWIGCEHHEYSDIALIGDSFVENMMNPIECHQCTCLEQLATNVNVNEYARSGVSFIESFQILSSLDPSPTIGLIYINDTDIKESISNIRRYSDRTQIDIENQEVTVGQIKSSRLKEVVYKIKFVYMGFRVMKDYYNSKRRRTSEKQNKKVYVNEKTKLLQYIKKNFEIENLLIVVNTDVEQEDIELVKKAFRHVLILNDDKGALTFENDKHWTCYGNNEVAKQVHNYLINSKLIKS